MAEERATSRLDAAFRVTAALVGTLPASVLLAAAVAKFLPLKEEVRVVLGFTLAVPLWVFAMCLAFVARRGAWAWIWCIGVAVVCSAVYRG